MNKILVTVIAILFSVNSGAGLVKPKPIIPTEWIAFSDLPEKRGYLKDEGQYIYYKITKNKEKIDKGYDACSKKYKDFNDEFDCFDRVISDLEIEASKKYAPRASNEYYRLNYMGKSKEELKNIAKALTKKMLSMPYPKSTDSHGSDKYYGYIDRGDLQDEIEYIYLEELELGVPVFR